MVDGREVFLLINCFRCGGAERVIEIVAKRINAHGGKATVYVTCQDPGEAVSYENTEIHSLKEWPVRIPAVTRICFRLINYFARFAIHFFKFIKKKLPGFIGYLLFWSKYYTEVRQIKMMMREHPKATFIAFLPPTFYMVLLAGKNEKNRIIISERGNPYSYPNTREGMYFINHVFQRADCCVFQTESARAFYPEHIKRKSVVIANPLKSNLPAPYVGEREKVVVNFCRISTQKNLPLLIKAFAKFHDLHPEYKLKIYGDASTNEGAAVLAELRILIDDNQLGDAVDLYGFSADIHERIRKCAMFVSSSDYEGISNSMLEAMAIGLPCVCTDCPAGGARATIRDHYNGILVPINDEVKLYEAMDEIASDPDLALMLSVHAAEIRDKLDADSIYKNWEEIL